MALLHIPLPEIDERQLQRLIDGRAPESREIDYKSALYGGANAMDEWLADVSSFANTSGGDMVFGIKEAEGVPTSFAPLTEDLDKVTRDLQQSADTGLQPRLPPLQFKRINLAAGGEVLIVRISRSYNPPHRVVRHGSRRQMFYARQDARRYEPDVDELRGLFTAAPQLLSRMRDFRADRVAKIAARDTPVELMGRDVLILHVVPFSAFDPSSLVSLATIDKTPHAFPPLGATAARDWRVNFDGVLLPSNTDKAAPAHRAYTQVYRTGVIEAVASDITGGERPAGVGPRLLTMRLEGQILSQLVRYLKGLNALGVEPPFAVMMSLIGVKGVLMNVGIKQAWHDDDAIVALERDQYHFGELILNSVPTSVQECGAMLRPFLEQLANTAGRASSPSFGPQGEYLHAFQ